MMRRLLRLSALAGTLVLVTGCPFIGSGTYSTDIQDYDGDGVIAVRFGGEDCRDDDASVLTCDADGDGFDASNLGGTDCNDDDATIHPDGVELCNGIDDDCDGLVDDDDPDPKGDVAAWHADFDVDGFGDADNPSHACTRPDGYTADSRDCDDTRADVYPGAPEFCDDIDRDCTGDPRDAVDQLDFYPDEDGDGFGRPLEAGESVVKSCTVPAGLAASSDDCDDTDGSVYPGAGDSWYDGIDSNCDGANDYDQDGDGHSAVSGGGLDCDDKNPAIHRDAVEVCDNGVDNDCDGLADDDDHNEDPVDPTGQLSYFHDQDGDLYGGVEQKFCVDRAPAGWLLQGGDCDDSRADVVPGATEICDLADNNCNGLIDDNAVDAVQYYADADGDGHGGVVVFACDLRFGLTDTPGDCNDADAATHPGAPEICGDAVRQDCTALSVNDCDSDGFEDMDAGGTDCDDSRADVFPGGTEVCDGHDNDCDGDFDGDDSDIGTSDLKTWYVDDDGDGHGTSVPVVAGACTPPPGTADNTDDCDDSDGDVFPGAPERCDGVANDCDAPTLIDVDPIYDIPEYHLDGDLDGFGSPNVSWAQTCAAPSTGQWTLDASDCNDADIDVSPAANEVCDGVDNDCDGSVDADDPSVQPPVWYADNDGDGWGVATDAVVGCSQPAGYVSGAGDCNDFDDTTNPAAPEVCDGGADNDCDGQADDQDPDVSSTIVWYADTDSDGFGDPNTTLTRCSQPNNFVANDQDCDDGDLSVSPAAVETCDGRDNDCDGDLDDADSNVANTPQWYADTDNDGFGDLDAPSRACERPNGYLPQGGDCDDDTADVFPGAPEICDGLDNDCDGDVDDDDSGVQGDEWFVDADGDGHGSDTSIIRACLDPGNGWAPVDDDCDDTDAAVHAGSDEFCNGIDDDCDGQIDDADPSLVGGQSFWIDVDDDGFGNANYQVAACTAPSGYVANDTDCFDLSAATYPGAPELCDNLDNDCDGLDDASDPDVAGSGAQTFWLDSDSDGWGDDNNPVQACFQPGGYAWSGGDCDDTEPSVFPGAPEDCSDGLDNDCNGFVDDGFSQPHWPDNDSDGWGDPNATSIDTCGAAGYVPNDQDCDDGDPTLFPGSGQIILVDGGTNGLAIVQEAVDMACDGNVIEIDANHGPYTEPIVLSKRSLTFRGINGRAVIEVNNGPAVQIDGDGTFGPNNFAGLEFRDIDNSFNTGGAFHISQFATVFIDDVSIESASAGVGSALYIHESYVQLRNAEIRNTTDDSTGAIYADFNTYLEAEDVLFNNCTGGAIGTFQAEVVLRRVEVFNSYGNGTGSINLDESMATIEDLRLGETSGLHVTNYSSFRDVSLTRARIYRTRGHALGVWGQNAFVNASNLAIAGVFDDNTYSYAGHALNLEDNGGISLRQGTLVGTDGAGVFLDNGGHGEIINTIVADNDGGNFDQGSAGSDPSVTSLMYDTAVTGALGFVGATNSVHASPDFVGWRTRYVAPHSIDLTLHNMSGRVSPGIDMGDSGTIDPDSTVSDIGASGGELAGHWFEHYFDSDTDGLYDGWEMLWFGSLSEGPGDDFDGDGMDNGTELDQGSSPRYTDSDEDGVDDDVDAEPMNDKVF